MMFPNVLSKRLNQCEWERDGGMVVCKKRKCEAACILFAEKQHKTHKRCGAQ